MPTLTQQQIDDLQDRITAGEISEFYSDLYGLGDAYGLLAGAVTDNSSWQGELAIKFAEYGALDNEEDISYGGSEWLALNEDIAQRYLNAYVANSNSTPDWEAVQTLHNTAYANAGLDADDWFPNKLLNDSADPSALWADYLTNDGAGDLIGDAGDVLASGGKYLFGPYLLYKAIKDGSLNEDELTFAKSFANALANMSTDALGDMAIDTTIPTGLKNLADLLSEIPAAARGVIPDFGDLIDIPAGLLDRLLPDWLDGPREDFDDAPEQASPLVVDLDSDGIELTTFNAASTATFFDLDNDGFAEQTAWVGADDGLLVRDLDANGTIDNANELFGSATVDGFALLAELDSNGDLFIDANDADWSDLRIWQDTNSDAVTQDGELQTLASLDIVSISLVGIEASTSTINGNAISHTSTFKYDNGSTESIVDAWFVHDDVNTIYVEDYALDENAIFLPTLRGFGELPDLHVAASSNGDLLDALEDFASGWDFDVFADAGTLNSDIENILYEWAGVESVSPTSRGANVNAQHLEFLEKFFW